MPPHGRLTFYIPFIILMVFLTLMIGQQAFAQNTVNDAWQKNIPSKAASLKEEAKLLIKQRDYQGAIAKLEQCLTLKPDYYLAAYNLALTYALRATDLQAPSEPDRKRAWREIDRAQTIAEAQGIWDAVLYTTMGWLATREAILSQPEDFSRRTEWYEVAERYWENALKIDPASASSLNNLGALYELRGDQKRALEYYTKAKNLKEAKGEENHHRLQQLIITAGSSPSIPRIEVTKSTLEIKWPSLSDVFRIKNVSDKQAKWYVKGFPNQVFSLYGHASEGTLEANVWSDPIQVRGHYEHIIKQSTDKHLFYIILDYGDFLTQEQITVITDDPGTLGFP